MTDQVVIEEAMLAALREAREPVKEAVLHERVRAHGVDPTPEELIAAAERLAVEGRVHMTVDREPRRPEPAPFEPRYWRVVE